MRRTEVPEPRVVSRGEGEVRPPRDDTHLLGMNIPLPRLGKHENIELFLARFKRHANLMKLQGEWLCA